MNQLEIVPTQITNFNRSDAELQAFWIFGCVVAGKNSDFAAGVLSRLLNRCPKDVSPFEHFRGLGENGIRNALVAARAGNYTRITRFLMESLDLDLRHASFDELIKVHGIGPKTASFFLLHSRPHVEVAVLDTHVLKYLRDKGVDAPTSTPTDLRKYKELQGAFLYLSKIDFPFMDAAKRDLLVWMKYSNRLETF
jgi:hypothetical protein